MTSSLGVDTYTITLQFTPGDPNYQTQVVNTSVTSSTTNSGASFS